MRHSLGASTVTIAVSAAVTTAAAYLFFMFPFVAVVGGKRYANAQKETSVGRTGNTTRDYGRE